MNFFFALNRKNKTAVHVTAWPHWELLQGALRVGLAMPDGETATGIGRCEDEAEFKRRCQHSGYTILPEKLWFTVILMLPDYATDQYGETWCGPVAAANIAEAVLAAQQQCAAQNTAATAIGLADLLPVSIFAGKHDDLIGQWAAIATAS